MLLGTDEVDCRLLLGETDWRSSGDKDRDGSPLPGERSPPRCGDKEAVDGRWPKELLL